MWVSESLRVRMFARDANWESLESFKQMGWGECLVLRVHTLKMKELSIE